jgi:hypothetical protein
MLRWLHHHRIYRLVNSKNTENIYQLPTNPIGGQIISYKDDYKSVYLLFKVSENHSWLFPANFSLTYTNSLEIAHDQINLHAFPETKERVLAAPI